MKLIVLPLLLAGSLALLTACGQNQQESGPAIATVNGETITQKEYEEYLTARQTQQPPIADEERQRELVLDEMINRILLAQEAERNKLDDAADVRLQIKRGRENILARAMLRQHLADNPVTDEEVEKRYQKEVEKTHKTEYRARHILLKTEDEARDIIAQINKGANFAKLAQAHSVDARSGKQGGDIGWFNQGQMIPEFFNAAMQLKKGEYTKEPVKTEFGWHVIKVEDTRPLKPPTLEEVREGIEQLLQQERIDQVMKDLRAKAKIEKN